MTRTIEASRLHGAKRNAGTIAAPRRSRISLRSIPGYALTQRLLTLSEPGITLALRANELKELHCDGQNEEEA